MNSKPTSLSSTRSSRPGPSCDASIRVGLADRQDASHVLAVSEVAVG